MLRRGGAASVSCDFRPPAGRGRGRGHGLTLAYDRGDQRFKNRWSNRAIPPPPKTPCTDPLEMPFPKLRQRNLNGNITCDEELLRAIIGQFNAKSVASLPFLDIFEKVKQDNGHLSYLLYNDPDYLWAYIRCYPEQFCVDHDPRFPNHVRYLSKCKIVAKSDRKRYERELNEGNLRVDPWISSEEWDRIPYAIDLERASVICISAVFRQLNKKMLMSGQPPIIHLPMDFIKKTVEKGSLPGPVLKYVGEKLEDFLYRRTHYFNCFGSQVSLRPADFLNVIRALSQRLRCQGDKWNLKDFFAFFLSSPYLGHSAIRSISAEPRSFQYDDFLMFLHNHKFVFRLHPRDEMVELRHEMLAEVTEREIWKVPAYNTIEEIEKAQDLERFDQDCSGFKRNGSISNGYDAGSENDNADCGDRLYFGPSAYTKRWMSEYFGVGSSSSSDDDGAGDDTLTTDNWFDGVVPAPMTSAAQTKTTNKAQVNPAAAVLASSAIWSSLCQTNATTSAYPEVHEITATPTYQVDGAPTYLAVAQGFTATSSATKPKADNEWPTLASSSTVRSRPLASQSTVSSSTSSSSSSEKGRTAKKSFDWKDLEAELEDFGPVTSESIRRAVLDAEWNGCC